MGSPLDAVHKEIQAKMRSAMNEVRSKNEIDLRTEVHAFYGQGSPTLYVRTGSLATSPQFTGVSGGGDFLTFQESLVYPSVSSFNRQRFLERGYASWFSGEEVLQASESGSSGVQGRGGFWARSMAKVEQNIQSAFHGAGFS